MKFQTKHIMTEIIDKLFLTIEPISFVRAFWLVGSVAKNTVDEYSDLDFWIDFDSEQESAESKIFDSVDIALTSIAPIDFKHKKIVPEKGVPYISQTTPLTVHKKIYHLEGTSEHLRITICWEEYSGTEKEYMFDKDNGVEPVKVLFDKANIIRSQTVDLSNFTERNKLLLDEAIYCRNRQFAFIEKNTSRLWYMESWYAYNRYVLESLIIILRLIYTPAYPLKYLNHITQHLPEKELKKLEYFTQISSLDDMKTKVVQAGEWFDELKDFLMSR